MHKTEKKKNLQPTTESNLTKKKNQININRVNECKQKRNRREKRT